MNILVVGSAGFIGSRIFKSIESKGLDVYAGIRKRREIAPAENNHSISVYKKDQKIETEFEVIINASGNYSNSSDLEELKRNIESNSLSAVEIAKLITPKTRRVVHLSSYFEFSPTLPGKPLSQYTASKILGRVTLEKFCNNLSTQFISCVLYDNYCEDLSRGKFVDQLIIACRKKEEFIVRNMHQKMDLIDLDYLVEKIIEVSLSTNDFPLNAIQIRSREVFTTGEIVKLAQDISDFKCVYRQDIANPKTATDKLTDIWDSAPDWPTSKAANCFQSYLSKMIKL